MNVSIVIPVYNPDKKILSMIVKSIKYQKFSGKTELKIIDRKEGYAKQMNYGIRHSKYDIVVMLHQDCVPQGRYWLNNLVKPLEKKEIIAANSKVQLPDFLWNKMDNFAKALIIKEKGTISPWLDGKGTAFKKRVITSVGLYNEKGFRTAGEDFDMYIRIRKKGTIAHPNAKVVHYHPSTFFKRLKKNYQYSNAFGALVRINGFDVPRWYVGIIKAIPLLGWAAYIIGFPYKGNMNLFPNYLIASLFDHFFYIGGFWKGFLMKKQTV